VDAAPVKLIFRRFVDSLVSRIFLSNKMLLLPRKLLQRGFAKFPFKRRSKTRKTLIISRELGATPLALFFGLG
jgi:hypothetical protein